MCFPLCLSPCYSIETPKSQSVFLHLAFSNKELQWWFLPRATVGSGSTLPPPGPCPQLPGSDLFRKLHRYEKQFFSVLTWICWHFSLVCDPLRQIISHFWFWDKRPGRQKTKYDHIHRPDLNMSFTLYMIYNHFEHSTCANTDLQLHQCLFFKIKSMNELKTFWCVSVTSSSKLELPLSSIYLFSVLPPIDRQK